MNRSTACEVAGRREFHATSAFGDGRIETLPNAKRTSSFRQPGGGGHLSGGRFVVVYIIFLACHRTNALGDWTLADVQESTLIAGVGSAAGFVGGNSQLQTIPGSGALNYSSEAASVASIFSVSGNQFTNSIAASRVLEIGPDGSDVGYASVLDNIWLDVSDAPSSAAISVVASNSDPQSELGFHWQLGGRMGRCWTSTRGWFKVSERWARRRRSSRYRWTEPTGLNSAGGWKEIPPLKAVLFLPMEPTARRQRLTSSRFRSRRPASSCARWPLPRSAVGGGARATGECKLGLARTAGLAGIAGIIANFR